LIELQLSKAVEATADSFGEWSNARDAYLQIPPDARGESVDEQSAESRRFLDVQAGILGFFRQHARIRDNWDPQLRYHVYPHGQCLYLRSIKQQEDYQFGIDGGECFLQVSVAAPHQIKHMKDEFWELLAAAGRIGGFKFQENAGCIYGDSEGLKPALMRNDGSNTFNLVRNAILLEQWCEDSLVDLGWLEYRWPADIAWDQFLVHGTHALAYLHRINYQLYRREYQRRRASSKRDSV
jgi:hypothetical protein